MRERLILMTPENAQKCHDGMNTQTRRVVKYNPILGESSDWCQKTEEPEFVRIMGDYRRFCPYGVVGDRLWVRERIASCRACQFTIYKGANLQHCPSCDHTASDASWLPSIHMPRFACRTVLEITKIRVERLQAISEEDAKAEGCPTHVVEHTFRKVYRDEKERAIQRIESFQRLWESINGNGSWALNPWVWVLTFRKVG